MARVTDIIDRTFDDYGYFYLSEEPIEDGIIIVTGSYTFMGSTNDYKVYLPTNPNHHHEKIRDEHGYEVADLSYIRNGPQHYQNCIVVDSEQENWIVYIDNVVYYVEDPPTPPDPEYNEPKEGDFVNLYSVTPDPLSGGGIFSTLGDTDMPWYETLGAGMALKLDLAYYGVISGGKIISPFIDKLLNDDGVISTETMDTIAGVIESMYTPKWSKLWETLIAEYDPIENYNMTEEMTDDETVTEYGRSRTRTDNLSHSETRTDNLAHSETRTDNLSHSETRTDNLAHSETRTDNLAHSETRTDNLTHTVDEEEKTTPGITTTRQDATRGFNSSADVNTDKVTESASGYTTVEHDNTEHNTGTQSTQGSDTGTQSTQGSDTGTQSTQGSDTGTQSTSGSNTGTQTTSGTNTGTQTDADTGSDTQTRNYTLTRSGNIGVTTTQQMLQQQRELYAWNYFYEVVFPDVDKLLTIQTY